MIVTGLLISCPNQKVVCSPMEHRSEPAHNISPLCQLGACMFGEGRMWVVGGRGGRWGCSVMQVRGSFLPDRKCEVRVGRLWFRLW